MWRRRVFIELVTASRTDFKSWPYLTWCYHGAASKFGLLGEHQILFSYFDFKTRQNNPFFFFFFFKKCSFSFPKGSLFNIFLRFVPHPEPELFHFLWKLMFANKRQQKKKSASVTCGPQMLFVWQIGWHLRRGSDQTRLLLLPLCPCALGSLGYSLLVGSKCMVIVVPRLKCRVSRQMNFFFQMRNVVGYSENHAVHLWSQVYVTSSIMGYFLKWSFSHWPTMRQKN